MTIYKISKENTTFGDNEIEKQTLHQHKGPISINCVYVSKMLVSNKVPFGKKGFKYFIFYKDGKKTDLYM